MTGIFSVSYLESSDPILEEEAMRRKRCLPGEMAAFGLSHGVNVDADFWKNSKFFRPIR